MGKAKRMMRKDLMVLGALTQQTEMSLFEITNLTGLWPSSAKAALLRLAARDWVQARFEPGDWPRRILYRLPLRWVQQVYLDHTDLGQSLMLDGEEERKG